MEEMHSRVCACRAGYTLGFAPLSSFVCVIAALQCSFQTQINTFTALVARCIIRQPVLSIRVNVIINVFVLHGSPMHHSDLRTPKILAKVR